MKGAISYVAIATVIFSHVKITCYFHTWRYQVFARKLTWYFIGKYFFCSKTNRRSLLWAEFGICIGRESSNVLNKIWLFETCTFSLWYSLNHLKVLEKNSFDSWQYEKTCSIESGLRQKVHLSSDANLYFSSSFFVVIILCTTLKVNCLRLLSFQDLYIFTKKSPQSGSSEKLFSKLLLRRVLN